MTWTHCEHLVVLVDSSVWIDYFNGRGSAATDRLDELLSSTIIVVGDLILAEVLQGFQSKADYRTAKRLLLALDVRCICGVDLALRASENVRVLRGKGLTVRTTIDCVIATFCIDNDIPILTTDRDFEPFVRFLGLQSALSN